MGCEVEVKMEFTGNPKARHCVPPLYDSIGWKIYDPCINLCQKEKVAGKLLLVLSIRNTHISKILICRTKKKDSKNAGNLVKRFDLGFPGTKIAPQQNKLREQISFINECVGTFTQVS